MKQTKEIIKRIKIKIDIIQKQQKEEYNKGNILKYQYLCNELKGISFVYQMLK